MRSAKAPQSRGKARKNLSMPLVSISKAFHVGTMDPAHKRPGSQEGAGLSISKHPDEWRSIARGLVTGDTWICKRTDGPGQFLSVHKMTKDQRALISNWALETGLVQTATLFEVSYFDDELEDEVRFFTETEDGAHREAEEFDAQIAAVPALIATDALKAASHGPCEPIMVPDMIAIAYAEACLDIDGCWWADILDPHRLSAPRGVIFKTMLDRWTFQR